MILAVVLAIGSVTVPPVPLGYFPQWVWMHGNGEVIDIALPPEGSIDWSEDKANCNSVWSDTNLYDGNPLANRCRGQI